ncbi:hypothetical protein ACO2Q3_06585 [Caulobacter sp. KR2-114]|uniref:hypothetical protein n=1 Tax=Caulobacter sp. KR2-114 TaxID=3400912 RepID=UPI003C0AE2C0
MLRLALLLVLAGSALTALAALFAWYAEEHRRLGRAFRKVLGGPPDTELIAHGQGRGVAFSLARNVIAVAWDNGAWCLVYRLEELVGAELAIDGQVAARAFRGEARRPLDQRPRDAGSVALRLVFDDAQHPDFDLPLWPPPPNHRRAPQTAGAVIQDANRWLARVEAVLRRQAPATPRPAPIPAAVAPPPAPPPEPPPPSALDIPPWEDDPDEALEDEALDDEGLEDGGGQGRLL